MSQQFRFARQDESIVVQVNDIWLLLIVGAAETPPIDRIGHDNGVESFRLSIEVYKPMYLQIYPSFQPIGEDRDLKANISLECAKASSH